jgi:8-oxo-dGTP pyrophosphatase MutT (NUDIX family)
MLELDQLDIESFERRLNDELESTEDIPLSLLHQTNPGKSLNKAAVLVPLLRHNSSWHVLYIRRAEHEMDRHSGQVAFAGGRYEETDKDLEHTALRETHEEIGVRPEHITVIGHLGFHHSISHFEITPVVGTFDWPYPLHLDSSEVARAFTIPLAWLADPANHRIEHRELNGQSLPVVYFDEYDGEVLWGATARMTLSLISTLQA